MQNGGDHGLAEAIMVASNPAAPKNAQQAAMAHLESFKQSPEGWKVCVSMLHQPCRDEVKFWCLGVALEVVRGRYPQMSEEDRSHIRNTVMCFVRDVVPQQPQTPFIKTKLSVVLVALVKQDFPTRWPSFFKDFLSLLPQGPEVVDMFLRVLKAVHQEVVMINDRRSPEELAHNTLIKDNMRETCIPDIVSTLHNLMTTCKDTMPGLSSMCLETLTDYVEWIDINLIANERFVGTLYSFLGRAELQIAACGCLHEIMRKRMDMGKKLELLKQLDILRVLKQLDMSKAGQEFTFKVAALVNTLAVQLILCSESFLSDGSGGHAAANEVAVLLSEAMRIACGLAKQHWEAGQHVGECLLNFSLLVKVVQQPTPDQVATFCDVFSVVTQAMQYPEWYDHDDQDDREAQFLRYRQHMDKIFANMMGSQPSLREKVFELTLQVVSETLQHMQQVPYSQVEMALHLVFLAPQHLKLSPTDEPLSSLAAGVLQSGVNKHPHPEVARVYINLVVRYRGFFDQHPNMLVPALLGFMDERGMRHPHPKVRSRSCYQLLRLVKSLQEPARAQVRPHLDSIVKTLQELMEPVLVKGMRRGVKTLIQYDDCVLLCEVIGHLIGSNMTGAKVREYFGNTLAFFRKQLDWALGQCQQWAQADPELAGKRLSQLVKCIAALSKPMRHDAQAIGDLLAGCFGPVVEIHRLLPNHPGVREKTVFFLHRMLEVVGEQTLPHMTVVLEQLIAHTDAGNLQELVQLVNASLKKFKDKMIPVLDPIFMPIVTKAFECIQGYAHVDGPEAEGHAAFNTDRVELNNLRQVYYSFLRDVSLEAPAVMNSERNVPHQQQVLTTLMQGCVSPGEPSVNKTCFKTLQYLAKYWHQRGQGQLDAGLRSFVFNDMTTQVFKCALAPHFDVQKNASMLKLCREMSELQLKLAEMWPNAYAQHVGEMLMAQLGLPENVAREYVATLQSGNTKAFQKFFKQMVLHLRQNRR